MIGSSKKVVKNEMVEEILCVRNLLFPVIIDYFKFVFFFGQGGGGGGGGGGGVKKI